MNPATCIVFVYVQDILGNTITSGNFSVRGGSFRYGTTFVDETYSSTPLTSGGFGSLTVVESETPGVYYTFSLSYMVNNTTKQINFQPVMIPNSGMINLASIAAFAN